MNQDRGTAFPMWTLGSSLIQLFLATAYIGLTLSLPLTASTTPALPLTSGRSSCSIKGRSELMLCSYLQKERGRRGEARAKTGLPSAPTY